MKQEPKRPLKFKNLYFDKKGFDARDPRAKTGQSTDKPESWTSSNKEPLLNTKKDRVISTGTLKLTDNEENESAESSATRIFFSAKCAHATKHHQQVKNN